MGFLKTDFSDQQSFLIVDTSYLVHALAFRAMNIYKREYDVPKDGKELWKIDFSEDEEFMGIFNRNFISMLKKLSIKHGVPAGEILLAMDCRKKNIWRRAHFDAYKIHRMTLEPTGLQRGPIFQYVQNKLIPKLEERGMCSKLYHPTAEGDDIVAVAKNYIRSKEPERKIIILASDHDLMQLIDDNTFIITTAGESVNKKTRGTPALDLMIKILIGDGADGIPACFKKVKGDKVLGRGFGPKAALTLLEDKALLKEKFNEYPEALEQFKLNRILVDFKNIPTTIQKEIEAELDQLIYQ